MDLSEKSPIQMEIVNWSFDKVANILDGTVSFDTSKIARRGSHFKAVPKQHRVFKKFIMWECSGQVVLGWLNDGVIKE